MTTATSRQLFTPFMASIIIVILGLLVLGLQFAGWSPLDVLISQQITATGQACVDANLIWSTAVAPVSYLSLMLWFNTIAGSLTYRLYNRNDTAQNAMMGFVKISFIGAVGVTTVAMVTWLILALTHPGMPNIQDYGPTISSTR